MRIQDEAVDKPAIELVSWSSVLEMWSDWGGGWSEVEKNRLFLTGRLERQAVCLDQSTCGGHS